MADLDLIRAERLLHSARTLLAQGDMAGVAGLAYQAFESALIALTLEKDGANSGHHAARRQRAKELLRQHRDQIDFLWEIRNVDFYGNPRPFEPKRAPTREEIERAVDTVEEIIAEVKTMVEKSDEHG